MKIKKILSYKGKVYSIIFTMLRDEIREMLRDGYSKTIIVKVLNEELETNINYFTFVKWFDKNIKQNNNLRKNSQKEEVKKEQLKVQKQDTSASSINSTKEDDKPWWKKRVEELSKGMKESAIKR